jgi:hypothetical protein
MYDPARDIFTENQPSSAPPVDSYDLSALDTLAGLAAQAEIAPVPVKKESTFEPIEQNVEDVVRYSLKENGTRKDGVEEITGSGIGHEAIPDGGVDVAGTKHSLKITLHLKKDTDESKQQDMQSLKRAEANYEETEPVQKSEKLLDDNKEESPGSPTRGSPMRNDSPEEPTKLELPKQQLSEDISPNKHDVSIQDEPRSDKGDHSYPIPLSLSRLTKIPKRKAEERRDRPDRDPNRGRNDDLERRTNRPSRSPPYPRSPPRHTRSPAPRLTEDRYRPSTHPLIDSYRPTRNRDDHYSPPKRPRSPSPPRQLKRPVRRDVTAADRERERRERQLRDAERQRAELEAARSRPVYESVRQHYNDKEERGREARQESRIFKLRKFNNWIKSVLIAKFIPERTEEQIDEDRGLFVLDIGCGKGGDLGKWQKQPQVQAYVGVDVAEVSIMHAEQRAAELRGRRLSTRFFVMDCFVVISPVVLLTELGSDPFTIITESSSFRYCINAICHALRIRVRGESTDYVDERLQKSKTRRIFYRHNSLF